jgi:hypothetical protein
MRVLLKKRSWQWLIGLTTLLTICGLSTIVHAQTSSQPVIQDQRHLLSAAQRQRIIEANQRWQRDRNQPAIWVYTLKRLPDAVTNDPAFGTRNEDAVMSFRGFTEDVLQRNAHNEVPAHVNEDRQTAIAQQAGRDGQHVSFIIVYPAKSQLHTIFVPSDDVDTATSDLQTWLLNFRLPSKQGNGSSVMAYFDRYQPFITKHVATTSKIKPGPGWGKVTFWLFLAILIPWLVIRKLTHPGSHIDWSTAGNDNFGEGYFWGWFDSNHFGGGNGGWGPWW